MAFLYECLNDLDDLLYFVGSPGVDIRSFDTKSVSILKIFCNESFRQFRDSYSHLVCTSDHFVVYVGEILDKRHLVAGRLKISPKEVKENERPSVADVEKIIYSRSADVKSDLVFFYWFKWFFFSR